MNFYIKVPNGDLVNLDQIFYIDVQESTSEEYDHCVWSYCTDSDYNPTNKRNFFPAKALAWGSKEYCEYIKEQIENFLIEQHSLVVLEGENTVLEISSEKDLVEEPKLPPPPEWFRNLPPNEDNFDTDIQL